jgi:hypothetical protein
MKRITILFMLALMFLAACNGGGYKPPSDKDYYVGTQGVVMTLPVKQKVTQVFENSEFYSAIQIKNEGAYGIDDYANGVYGYLTINLDTFYISYLQEGAGAESSNSGSLYEQFLAKFRNDLTLHPDKAIVYPFPILLEGKSYTNPVGGQDLIELNFLTNKVTGQSESPETQIVYTLCYPYKTIFSKPVCIDADPLEWTQETRSALPIQRPTLEGRVLR